MAEQRKKEQRRRFITFGVLGVVVVGGLWAWSAFGGDDSEDSADSTTTTTATAGPPPDTSLGVINAILGLNQDDPSSGLGGAPSRTVTINSVTIEETPGNSTTTAASSDFEYGTTECAPDTPPDEPVIDYDDAFQDCLDPGATYTAVFDTTEGEIRVNLDTGTTPGTVNNFVNLARNGYYDGTEIFRTDTSIGIIQGGSPHTNDASDPGPGYTIPDEGSGFTYGPGQLVMARTNDPNSASAQFFFVATDAASALDGQGTYVVFGTTDDFGDAGGSTTTTAAG